MDAYDHNRDVVAIAGSRAIAIKADKMDFPGLKLVQLTSAGFDGVPLAEYRDKGVMVANAGSTYSVPIAETVVLGMLLMAKNFIQIQTIVTQRFNVTILKSRNCMRRKL